MAVSRPPEYRSSRYAPCMPLVAALRNGTNPRNSGVSDDCDQLVAHD